MRILEPWHLIILTAVFVALFGAKRLPDSARSLGESLHIFKKALHEDPDVAPSSRTDRAAVNQSGPEQALRQ